MYFVGINIGIDKTTVSRSPGYNGEQVSQIILNPHSYGDLGSNIIDTAICKNNGEWSLPYDIDSSSIDSKRNINISSHLFLSNKDVNSILEERIMKYAIKVFREHMYFDVKY